MKAIHLMAYGNPAQHLQLVEVAEPNAPVMGEVLVRMEHAPVDYSDLLLANGVYFLNPQLPSVIGGEGAGIVEALGPGVSNVKVGDRVTIPFRTFTWAEKVLAQENGQASMGYSVHSRRPPLRQAGRGRRSAPSRRCPGRSPMLTGMESFPFFLRLLHTTPFAAVENRQRAKTMMNVKLYCFTQAIMSLTTISGTVTGRADGARLARRERTRAGSLRYCYPPASIAHAGAGARPMRPR